MLLYPYEKQVWIFKVQIYKYSLLEKEGVNSEI